MPDSAPVLDAPSTEPISEAGRRVSEADYWAYYYDHEIAYEWNNGRLEVKPVSDFLTSLVYQWFLFLLRHYLETHPIAQTTVLDMGFRLALPHKTVIRKPDLAVVHANNPVQFQAADCSYQGVYDLCIEALSDQDPAGIERDTQTKRAEYEAGGVREYYILHHQPRWQLFYARNTAGLYQPLVPQQGVIQSTVLPGFQFRPEDLTRQPDTQAMLDDPVYQSFVSPAWQADRAARAFAEEQAEQAAKRAQEEAAARWQEAEARRQETIARQLAEQRAAEARQAEAAARRASAQQATEQAQRAAAAEAEIARLKAALQNRQDTSRDD